MGGVFLGGLEGLLGLEVFLGGLEGLLEVFLGGLEGLLGRGDFFPMLLSVHILFLQFVGPGLWFCHDITFAYFFCM